PCTREAPLLEKAQKRLAKEGGTVFGVTYKDRASASRDFARKEGYTFPSVRDDELDLAPEFGTIRLPETFVIDPRGRVVAISRGSPSCCRDGGAARVSRPRRMPWTYRRRAPRRIDSGSTTISRATAHEPRDAGPRRRRHDGLRGLRRRLRLLHLAVRAAARP